MKHIAYLPNLNFEHAQQGFNIKNVRFLDSESTSIIKTILAEFIFLDHSFLYATENYHAKRASLPLVTIESYTPTQCIKMEDAYITQLDVGTNRCVVMSDQLKCRYLRTNDIVIFTNASDMMKEDASLMRFLDLEEE